MHRCLLTLIALALLVPSPALRAGDAHACDADQGTARAHADHGSAHHATSNHTAGHDLDAKPAVDPGHNDCNNCADMGGCQDHECGEACQWTSSFTGLHQRVVRPALPAGNAQPISLAPTQPAAGHPRLLLRPPIAS